MRTNIASQRRISSLCWDAVWTLKRASENSQYRRWLWTRPLLLAQSGQRTWELKSTELRRPELEQRVAENHQRWTGRTIFCSAVLSVAARCVRLQIRPLRAPSRSAHVGLVQPGTKPKDPEENWSSLKLATDWLSPKSPKRQYFTAAFFMFYICFSRSSSYSQTFFFWVLTLSSSALGVKYPAQMPLCDFCPLGYLQKTHLIKSNLQSFRRFFKENALKGKSAAERPMLIVAVQSSAVIFVSQFDSVMCISSGCCML